LARTIPEADVNYGLFYKASASCRAATIGVSGAGDNDYTATTTTARRRTGPKPSAVSTIASLSPPPDVSDVTERRGTPSQQPRSAPDDRR
jgi:hypothetical protein